MRARERGEAGGLKRPKRSGRATVWGIEALTGERADRFAPDRLYPTTGPTPEQANAQDTSTRGAGGREKKKASQGPCAYVRAARTLKREASEVASLNKECFPSK